MAQIVKGSVVRKNGAGGVSHGMAMNHQEQAAPGNGMIVGAVVNKPTVPSPQVPAAMTMSQGAQGHMGGQGHKSDVKPLHIQMPPTLFKPPNQQQQQQSQSVGKSDADHQSNGAQQEQTLANTKEKTPMCLINELARFNKIQHQYTLTDEQGPAHKKTFYVKLKLGDEEYAANGPSIKKAQHAAADIALGKTQYKHPPPKPPKLDVAGIYPDSITPTVELNAIAMKRGEPAVYRAIEMPRNQYGSPSMDFRGMYNQRYHYPKHPRVFYVSLKVGQREFIGEGNTRQAARHNAAFKALKILRALPLPTHDGKPQQPEEPVTPPSTPETNGVTLETKADEENGEDDLKSEISLVHEIALKRNMAVNFEVMRESGPPHMRTFVTRCTVGKFVTDGEGNGKKLSKKRAAEKMLEELKILPQLPQTTIKSKKALGNKKKNRNLIKVTPHLQKANPDYGVGINPISRLIQIQQAKKEKEPVYSLIREGGMPRKREFDMQVQVGDHIATGVGPNKKLAKRNAAEAMLQVLGYSRPAPQPSKPAIKTGEGQVVSDKKVTFMEAEGNPTEVSYANQYGERNRQMIPGILMMPDGRGTQGGGGQPFGTNKSSMNRSPGQYQGNMSMASKVLPQTTAAIAKELLESGVSPTAESIIKTGAKPLNSDQKTVRHKQQLLYLSEVLGFQVQFTDFPKGSNKTEFLSLVSLSTNPAHVSHGAGLTIEESHDIGSLSALKWLSELGLDNVSNKKNVDNMGAGDGPHVKVEKTG